MKHSFRCTLLAIAGIFSLSLIASADTFTREIDREFNASDFEKLVVRVSSGSIVAVTGNDSRVKIEIDLTTKTGDLADAEALFDKTEILFDEGGNDLSMTIKKLPRKGFFSLFSRNKNRVTAEVRVVVPKNFDVNLDIGSGRIDADGLLGNIVMDTGSGSIKGVNLTGNITADTGSGNITLSAIEGNIHADTGSGSIRISEMNGELIADTGSGSIDVSGDIHRFKVDTGSGSVKIQSFVGIKDRSVADTGSGSIRLRLPGTSGFVLDADVGSGGIDCAFPLSEVEQKKDSLKAIANNGGALVRLDTGSGSISVLPN